ncbi:c-type cytochrome [Massilia arenosa]|uniref:C-type cytochrome n=2 Tax=Zemynaea arenosa TaxID=2561931 RepID=A0A4Y9SGI0_9BURK|nr:c-type cytochrome [Massilia arenosa]
MAALALSALGAAPAWADRPAVLPDTLQQRIAPCLSCHARTDRDDAFFPRLAGKPAGYLYNQLINFQQGRRRYPLMTWMVAPLPDPYLHEIADYFANADLARPPAPVVTASPTERARGEQLVQRGDPALKVPACVACHGAALTGAQPAIPGLTGLPRDYINAQLGAWKNGDRHALAPDCMAEIARRLPLQDVTAISAYLAAQPVPQHGAVATPIHRPLPLACGSAPDQP